MERYTDFETLLRNESEKLRMKPRSNVWENIQSTIHPAPKENRKLFGLIIIAFVAAALFTTDLSKPSLWLTFTKHQSYIATPNITSTAESTDNTLRLSKVATQDKTTNINTASNYLANNTINANTRHKTTVNNSAALYKDAAMPSIGTSTEAVEAINNNSTTLTAITYAPIVKESTNEKQHKPTLPLPKANQEKREIAPAQQDITIRVTNRKPAARFQYYLTPGMSYRALNNKFGQISPIPYANANISYIQDLDKAVHHKPAMGFEVGFAYTKPVGNILQLRLGTQLNYNRFNIKASNSIPEPATIALRSSYGNYTQNYNTVSNIRNSSTGFLPLWIENSNLQISMPIGLSVVTSNVSKVAFGLSATIQPSYLLKNKNLLLSTDLKNYTEAPALINRLNVNTSAETFVAVKSKKLQYQIGPQIRYQLLSTYNKTYPFKENLFDYGVKFSINKPF
jgi:hypothetical protein